MLVARMGINIYFKYKQERWSEGAIIVVGKGKAGTETYIRGCGVIAMQTIMVMASIM